MRHNFYCFLVWKSPTCDSELHIAWQQKTFEFRQRESRFLCWERTHAATADGDINGGCLRTELIKKNILQHMRGGLID